MGPLHVTILQTLVDRLLVRQASAGHWEGRLSSSALSTATAIVALGSVGEQALVRRGVTWLVEHQNADGGWGDTVASRSNISTTALAWSALSFAGATQPFRAAEERAAAWLRAAAGDTTPRALRAAILGRYGGDKTFSVPILMVLAMAGKLGSHPPAAWRQVPQLPFELAAIPHRWYHHARLPVVSYALPALIGIGQVRHHFAATRNPALRAIRGALRERTHALLQAMQPASGGYLEATPLTSFVVMSLAAMGRADSPVVRRGADFLRASIREDGSWPIDTHLTTWVTTMTVAALARAGAMCRIDRDAVRAWLLDQQTAAEHPFTHAAAGGWAWTPLSGGVPDADDTSGALVALKHLDPSGGSCRVAAAAGISWLAGVQNRDGGVPTFCRGWGTLPFDRSTPEITAHALEAWSAWHPVLDADRAQRVERAAGAAIGFLQRAQRPDGAWIPLWFGSEAAPHEENPTYGTARVLVGLAASLARADERAADCRRRGLRWLLAAQHADGGWGGDRGVAASIEETGLALHAVCCCAHGSDARVREAASRAAQWLTARVPDVAAAPIGLYFAKLWYFEELYPIIHAIDGLAAYEKLRGDSVDSSRAS